MSAVWKGGESDHMVFLPPYSAKMLGRIKVQFTAMSLEPELRKSQSPRHLNLSIQAGTTSFEPGDQGTKEHTYLYPLASEPIRHRNK